MTASQCQYSPTSPHQHNTGWSLLHSVRKGFKLGKIFLSGLSYRLKLLRFFQSKVVKTLDLILHENFPQVFYIETLKLRMSNIVIGMKKKEKSKDSLDESLDSLESGDRTDDSLEIFDDSLGMSQLKIGHNESLTCAFEM